MNNYSFYDRSILRSLLLTSVDELNELINNKTGSIPEELKNVFHKEKLDKLNIYIKLYKEDFA